MFIPQNEQGLVSLFCTIAKDIGWNIVSVGTRFPDAILEKDGMVYRVEFEYKAKNFITHGHDYTKCDMIICWINNLGNYHIPILSLNDNVLSEGIGLDTNYIKPWCKAQELDDNLEPKPPRKTSIVAYIDDELAEMIDTIKQKLEWEYSDSKLLIRLIEFGAKHVDMMANEISPNRESEKMAMVKLMIAMLNGDVKRNMEDAMKYLESISN